MGNLNNQVALVTGGAQGIGRGIVLELARSGADIIIADLDNDKSELVVTEVKALGRDAIALQLDVTDAASIQAGIETAFKHFPRIDILVNNAGVGPAEKGTAEEFDLTYAVNLRGVWQVSNALIPHFKTNQYGKIVNIASICGRRGSQLGPTAYSASKAAVINLTQSLATTLGPDNINVNAICPGVVKVPRMMKGLDLDKNPRFFEELAERTTQLKRVITPDDIGHAVVFMASSQARNITGQSLNVDGGYYMN